MLTSNTDISTPPVMATGYCNTGFVDDNTQQVNKYECVEDRSENETKKTLQINAKELSEVQQNDMAFHQREDDVEKSINCERTPEDKGVEAPDGGWGYVVLFGSFFTMVSCSNESGMRPIDTWLVL